MTGSGILTYRAATVSPGGGEIREMQEEKGISCSFSQEEAGIHIDYEETDGAGNHTACVLTVGTDAEGDGGKVLFERKGEIVSSFIFREGSVQPLRLETPYGQMVLEVETQELLIKKERQRIEVKIRYRMVDAADEEHLLEFLVDGA